MIDTKAVRALAERMTDWSYDERKGDGMLARNVGEALRQCADEIDTLRGLVQEAFEKSIDANFDWAERAEKALGD